MSFPGIDPRTWVSYGIVDAATPVDFDDDYGPLVSVELQPTGVPVYCRVSSSIAGDGEGEYHPFVGGDEVLVLLPQGRPDADPVIVGRMNNSRQKWPSSVGGQDATKNTFGFKRSRTPRVEELAGAILMRQAPSGAFLSIDTAGIVTLRDSAGSALQISPDVFGFQGADAKHVFQIDMTGDRAMLQVSDARFILAGAKATPFGSSLTVPDLLSILTLKNPAAEHVTTAEATANIIAQVFNVLGLALVALGAPPLTGASLGALLVDPVFSTTVLALGMTAAGAAPLNPAVSAAIAGAFAAATQKPPPAPGIGQAKPGIGCAGFLAG
jgi:hypothetical protein